jgi:hypothetical protein
MFGEHMRAGVVNSNQVAKTQVLILTCSDLILHLSKRLLYEVFHCSAQTKPQNPKGLEIDWSIVWSEMASIKVYARWV